MATSLNNLFKPRNAMEPAGAAGGRGSGAQAPRHSASAEAKWAARLVGAGSLLTLSYEIAYLALDKQFLSLRDPWILIFHLINIALFGVAVIMTLNVGPWMRMHWKMVAFSFSTVMIASSTAITIVTAQTQPLFIALMLFLAGTGPFLSWGERTQAMLSVVAFVAFGVTVAILPNSAVDPYQGLGIIIAAAIGLLSTALERRLRRARREAEAEVLRGRETLILQERLRLAGQLASGIAHDLNNTLNVVKLRFSALSQDETVKARHGARLAAIDRAIEDAARTVARVRGLAKGREDAGAEPVQLCEIIAQAIDLARSSIEGWPALSGSSIRISSRLPEFLPAVRGFASDLRQVFLNLLLNAADAVTREGEIQIDATVENAAVTVRVSDDGSGIPAEYLKRIFEPFFTTKGPRGSGLGLSTASETIESIGGSISAANRPAGGAVFTLKFPTAEVRAETTPALTPLKMGGGQRFLLVDDDAENVDSLREILVRDGHLVEIAASGAEAIAKISAGALYDIILCDLGMPGISGWEVAQNASQMARPANFYIVTGWGSTELERQLPTTVAGVLSKPIDLNELRRIAAAAPSRVRPPLNVRWMAAVNRA